MKKTHLITATSLIFLCVVYFVPNHSTTTNKPSDFRDAPADTMPALESLKTMGAFDNNPIPNVPAPAAVPAASTPAKNTAAAKKAWTVMLYANTKDQLGSSQLQNLLEMKKIGTTENVNVVAETGITQPAADGSTTTITFRMVLTKGEGAESLNSDIVAAGNHVDMGDWRKAAEFAKWAKANYPARRYVFILFGHGSGFYDPKKEPKENPEKGILFDEETDNYVTLPEFGQLMKEVGHVDALVMLSCLMQMSETIYEVKNYADVIVGSGETMWSVGYDLSGMLMYLNANPEMRSKDLGAMLVDSYVKRAKRVGKSGHASAIITKKIPGFTMRLNDWVEAAINTKDRAALNKARSGAVRFDWALSSKYPTADTSPFGDLYDFVRIFSQKLSADTPESRLAIAKSLDLMDYISNELVFKQASVGNTNIGYRFAQTHGLAIHIPMKLKGSFYSKVDESLQTRYSDLALTRETRWKEFLDWAYTKPVANQGDAAQTPAAP